MRLARRRAISRRKLFQIGFPITTGVFLSLMGLIVFERVMSLFSIVGFSSHGAGALETVFYGADEALGPWKVFALILAGLSFIQIYAALRAFRAKRGNKTEFCLGAANMAMILLYSFFLANNWAFFNADKPGAAQITRVSTIPPLHLFTSFEFWPDDEFETNSRFTEERGWVALDERTHINQAIGVIVKEETVHRNYPERITKPFLEARNIDPSFASAEYQYDYFYYDLDGRFIYAPEWLNVYKHAEARIKELQENRSDISPKELFDRLNAHHSAKSRERPFTYDEILQMVEASWESIPLDTPETELPNSSPE